MVQTGPASRHYTIALPKFLAMSFATAGLYYLYWMYKTWVRIRDVAPGESLSPFWRTFFSPLWIWSLLDHVKQEAISHGVPVQWSHVALSSVYVLVTVLGSVAGNFPDPWDALGLLTFTAMFVFIPPLLTMRRIDNALGVSEPRASRLTGWHIAILLLGSLLAGAEIVGAFVSIDDPFATIGDFA